MKRQLISTSAIALGVAMAAPATAQEWNMVWGGFSQVHVGVTDVDVDAGAVQSESTSFNGSFPAAGSSGDFDGVDVFINREIHFSPNVTLDNGLNVGFNIQFEGDNTGGNIVDESYVEIKSDTLGRLLLGNENSAGYKSMVGAPGVTTMWINSPSTSAFIPRTGQLGFEGFRQSAISTWTEVVGNNDVPRITYFTPSFHGLTVGVSYAATSDDGLDVPGVGTNDPVLNPTNPSVTPPGVSAGVNAGASFAPDRDSLDIEDIFDIGVGYSQSFAGVDVTITGRWGRAESNVAGIDDPKVWGVGAQFSYMGVTIGGHYGENDNGQANDAGDQQGYSVGITYDIAGPWAVEALTFQGEIDNGPGLPTSDYEAFRIGAARDLGPGVQWEIAYINSETNNGVAAGNPEIQGDLVVTTLNLSF